MTNNDPTRQDLYTTRKLVDGYPDMEQLGVDYFQREQSTATSALRTVQRAARLIDLAGVAPIVVVGCGPKPESVRALLDAGFNAVGVEPVAGFVATARDYLGAAERVMAGAAERLPFAGGTQRLVVMESVLEHVDSPEQSLAEAYRVLAPGGVLYVSTTNRWRFSPTGGNGEFRVPFYNWFPALVQESYVFRHLHYEPRLANFTPRPAVHWFSYSDLCRLGRRVGFAHFYSFLDLIDERRDTSMAGSRLKRFIVRNAREHPWFRALLLTQAGNAIYMWKRKEPGL